TVGRSGGRAIGALLLALAAAGSAFLGPLPPLVATKRTGRAALSGSSFHVAEPEASAAATAPAEAAADPSLWSWATAAAA
ncbi:unnamed protein product, partial [Polarella glacialis]